MKSPANILKNQGHTSSEPPQKYTQDQTPFPNQIT